MLLEDKSRVLPPAATIAFLGILLAVSLLFNIALFLRVQNIPDGISRYFFPSSQSQQAQMLASLENSQNGKAIINGKVWKRIDEPIFNMVFLKDDRCANCIDVEPLKQQLEATFPTGEGRMVLVSSEEGQELIQKGVSVVPAVLFTKAFEKTSAFANLAQSGVLAPVGEEYFEFRTNGNKRILAEAQLPTLEQTDPGRLTIVAYVDYLSQELTPYLSQLIPNVLSRFQQSVNISFRPFVNNLPSVYAAEAVLCGVELSKLNEVRGAYIEAVQGLVAGKQEVSPETMNQISAKLAELTQMQGPVSECYNSHAKANQVTAASAEATKLGINGAPAFFIGDRFLAGTPAVEVFLSTIEEVLKERNLATPEPTAKVEGTPSAPADEAAPAASAAAPATPAASATPAA
jgi:hypothetical protein